MGPSRPAQKGRLVAVPDSELRARLRGSEVRVPGSRAPVRSKSLRTLVVKKLER